MDGVAARAGGDVNCTGRSEFGRKIERGLKKLEFLNGAGRNVLCGGSDGLVAHVDAIDFDSGGTSETALEGDGRETVLGGIESAAFLNLNSGLELSEVEEIATVDGEILNLLKADHALHCCLLGIYGDC